MGKKYAIKVAGAEQDSLPSDYITQHIALDDAGYSLVDEDTFVAAMTAQDAKLAAWQTARAAATPAVAPPPQDIAALQAQLEAALAAVEAWQTAQATATAATPATPSTPQAPP